MDERPEQGFAAAFQPESQIMVKVLHGVPPSLIEHTRHGTSDLRQTVSQHRSSTSPGRLPTIRQCHQTGYNAARFCLGGTDVQAAERWRQNFFASVENPTRLFVELSRHFSGAIGAQATGRRRCSEILVVLISAEPSDAAALRASHIKICTAPEFASYQD